MGNQHGEFIWYELMTSDAVAAADFYGAVVGWKARAFDESAGGYRILAASDADVAGLLPITPEMAAKGVRPGWLGYIGVDDVDATAAAVVEAGGTQHLPPTDIPGVGRFAVLADPQGAVFQIMRGSMEGTSTVFAPMESGHCNWNELATSDQNAALSFYIDRFNWEKGDAMPMDGAGEYRFINRNGEMIGAVMNRMDEAAPPAWTFYFGVDDIDAAVKAVAEKGGAIHYGPAEVPGGAFIIVVADPEGAMVGFVGPRRQ
ncbi:VOC family protein [Aquamicrobium sp. LC103]|uniref:VOC family protein n=1 Tax=Aquamicrobium sp. LC103 TaxID=1120658 RepID=UPI00063EB58C|nr:VOC family protein [Aquamicrobium sp. LC103]TKT74673.1 VOC family protein [Aquamicrobium sp. LC103]